VILHPTRYKIGYFGDISQANLLAWHEKTKHNTTKSHIHQSKEMCNTKKLECGPMPNVMVAMPNIGDAHCSTPQSLAVAHY